MRFLRHLAVLALLALLAGCTSGGTGKVTIRGSDPKAVYAPAFDQAYISGTRDGEYDIVMIQDTIDPSRPAPASNRPLEPLRQSDFRQIVHIRVHWQAKGGSVAKDGVVTNSTISWYVLGAGTASKPEMVRYEGAGYVVLDESKRTVKVDIRDGLMRRTEIRGPLHDPLGASTLRGTVIARRSSAVVKELLADLNTKVESSATVTDSR